MADAVIIDAVRTPLGRRNGMLAGWHPVDLAAHTLRALVDRSDLDPALVDDVIMGCVMQVGDQALNIGRNAALAAGFPDTVPGTSINGDTSRRVPNTTNISFDGIEAESLLIALDLEGVAVSTGSACSSGSLEPSHVLRAMGGSNARTRNSLRFSLGPENTPAEVEFVLGVLPRLVTKLRGLTRTAAALR